MRSMTLTQVAQILNNSGTFSRSVIQGYCIDSRLLKSGELFIALKGERVDGHDYLKEVQKKGAIAAIVSKEFKGDIAGLKLIRVENPLFALQEVARTALVQSPSRIIAITGSIGKTTTKEFTKTLLETKYRVAATPGNSNSQAGLPIAILNHTSGDEEVLILEMGMTAAGQLSRLIQIAPPEVAVITAVALVHACNFETIEDIARAKSEILLHSYTRLGILHRDIPNFGEISRLGQCRKVSFSTTASNADYGVESEDSLIVQSRIENQAVSLGALPVPGKHNRQNLLAAIAVARHFNMEWEEIKQAIPLLLLPERRLQLIKQNGVIFLNDSYNASELSVKAALEALPQPEGKGRKIAVLGSMTELGKFSEECHRRVGEFALDFVEQLYCLGEECLPICAIWKQAGRPFQFFENRTDLVRSLRQNLQASDVVLLKGSRSKEIWKVLDEL